MFELVLESLDNPIDRSYFDETIETLIQNKKVKMSCYANKSCLSLPKQSEGNIENNEIDNTSRDDFHSLKNLMLSEFESMKSAFLKEVNSFKNQILDTPESTSHLRSQNDSNNNNNTLNVLERLITHLEDEVSTLKVQLDRKDKIINILLGKIENDVNEGTCKRPNERENSFITRNLSKGNNEENLTQLNVEEMNKRKITIAHSHQKKVQQKHQQKILHRDNQHLVTVMKMNPALKCLIQVQKILQNAKSQDKATTQISQ